MVKILPFPEYIYADKYEAKEYNLKVINFLKDYKKINKSIIKSNRGGYQTADIVDENICLPIVNITIDMIKKNLKFKKEREVKIILNNLWINENYKECYNIPHYHPNSNFSGVFYIKTPKECGNLIFIKEGGSYMNCLDSFLDGDIGNKYYTIEPQENLLILFPSNFLHFAEPNKSEESRISIAFNVSMSHG